jgi:hypothetical protein
MTPSDRTRGPHQTHTCAEILCSFDIDQTSGLHAVTCVGIGSVRRRQSPVSWCEQASSIVTKDMIKDSMACGPDVERIVSEIRDAIDSGVDHVPAPDRRRPRRLLQALVSRDRASRLRVETPPAAARPSMSA